MCTALTLQQTNSQFNARKEIAQTGLNEFWVSMVFQWQCYETESHHEHNRSESKHGRYTAWAFLVAAGCYK